MLVSGPPRARVRSGARPCLTPPLPPSFSKAQAQPQAYPQHQADPPYALPLQSPYAAAPANGAPAGSNVASIGVRLGARLIDGVLITLVYLVFSGIFLSSLAGSDISYSNDANGNLISTGGPGAGFFVSLLVGLLLVFLITLAYEVVMIALRGATVGKQLLGVKVVRESDGQVPDWGPSLLRWIVPLAPAIIPFIGALGTLVVYLSPLFDSSGRNQGWHDKVAKTLVISTR